MKPIFTFWACVLSVVVFMTLTFNMYYGGKPTDHFTWIVVLCCGSLAVLFVCLIKRNQRLKCGLIILVAAFFVPETGEYIQDVHGGRWGIEVQGLLFARDAPNTELLEHYLGKLEPEWKYLGPRSRFVRDGNERVDSRSIIRRDDLPAILAMLPTEDARKQVIECATDPRNLLRVHQSMLLVALHELGYPKGLDSQGWWDHHKWVFHRETDIERAVNVIWGWRIVLQELGSCHKTDSLGSQIRAADYQEQGSWGGDRAFAEVWFDDQYGYLSHFLTLPPEDDITLGVNRIRWWKACDEAELEKYREHR